MKQIKQNSPHLKLHFVNGIQDPANSAIPAGHNEPAPDSWRNQMAPLQGFFWGTLGKV